MSAKILDGKLIANNFLQALAEKISLIRVKQQRLPSLAVVLVGDDPASAIYVKNKRHVCKELGIISTDFNLASTTTEQELLVLINKLNLDPDIDGILVQLPLPKHINSKLILETILPDKDVDGFHPFNLGRLAQGIPTLRPCTPKGIMLLLEYTQISLPGMHAVIIGTSNIVGKPMFLELINARATVTVCNRATKNLAAVVGTADLLVVAAGSPSLVPGEWLKSGSIVIDVGINRLPSGKLIGDVEFNQAKEVAAWITPVPGGVGPMTIAALLDNTLLAYTWHNN